MPLWTNWESLCCAVDKSGPILIYARKGRAPHLQAAGDLLRACWVLSEGATGWGSHYVARSRPERPLIMHDEPKTEAMPQIPQAAIFPFLKKN